jgi:selenoprotein W-related protein
LKAELNRKIPGVKVTLIEGSGGVFEVKKDDQLIFSKKKIGRFPDHQEIIDRLQ